MEKIELIARIFAETGVKEMMWQIFALIQRNVKREKLIRLGDKWVPIDPRAWSNKMDMTVNVGLGTGSRDQLLAGSQIIGQIQLEMIKGGFLGRTVTEQNVYNYAHEVSAAVMPKKADLFFTDPSGMPPPEEKPDPKIEMQKQKAIMADKTKRDVTAVTFLTEIAKLKNAPPPQPQPPEDKTPDRMHEMGMARMQQDHEMAMQNETLKPQKDQTEILEMDAKKTDQVMELMKGQAQVLKQMQAMQAQMVKIMSAPKKLITDDNGEPIGVEPVLEDSE
jgi:hypothetical protein